MKQLLFTLFFISLAILTSGQPLGPGYVIHFTDKNNSPYTIANPSEFLSEAAIDRRNRQNIPIQMDDIPVNQTYLQAITTPGAQIAAVSRWFNTAAVWIQNPNIIPGLQALPFVSAVVPMNGNGSVKSKSNWKSKPFFENEMYDLSFVQNSSKALMTDYYNYGSASNQIQMVNGQHLHNQGYRGQGIAIAVLDAGFSNVDIIPAFDSLRAHGRILGALDFVQPGNNVYQSSIHSHGTMVLSTMGANLPGLMVGTAPEASYWLLRTEDANGPPGNSEYLMEEYFWVAGAEFADSVGVWVINSSLGYYEFDDPAQNHTYADMDGNSTPITMCANRAASKGIFVVNSAGNEGSSAWQYIIAPSDGNQVMAVGAVNASGNYAGFSSIGPSADGRVKPDIAAQGSGTAIVGSNGNVSNGSGTSFSSPVLAGMAACLWQSNMNLNRVNVYEAIVQSGSQYQNPDFLLGYGIPDFEQAQLLMNSIEMLPGRKHLINVYPNPSSTFIRIECNQPESAIHRIVISDISGKALIIEDYSQTNKVTVEYGLTELPAGLYLLRVDLDSGPETIKLIRF
ncbi:MAG: S8 family serine peptidase [Bacteroidales bacterium]|nr:S8 family serine peptidase [Bacteroidales bacterium]